MVIGTFVTRPRGRALAGVLAAFLVLGTMSPAAAAKKPPKITAVTTASRLVDQGAPLRFTIWAKNTSTKRSAPLGLIFVLSESSDYDDGVVLGSGALPALARKARVSLPFSVTIPSDQDDDDYRLLVCVPRAGKSPACGKNVSVDVEATAGASGSPGGGSTVPPGSGSVLPARILNLTNWKLTLPVDADGQTDERAAEVRQPALNSYQHPTWFLANAAGTGVVFRAHANGAKTSTNTKYARSELREMTSSYSNASWSPGSGTHSDHQTSGHEQARAGGRTDSRWFGRRAPGSVGRSAAVPFAGQRRGRGRPDHELRAGCAVHRQDQRELIRHQRDVQRHAEADELQARQLQQRMVFQGGLLHPVE